LRISFQILVFSVRGKHGSKHWGIPWGFWGRLRRGVGHHDDRRRIITVIAQATAQVTPAVDQVNFNPFVYRRA
jgi:hypothetical protein